MESGKGEEECMAKLIVQMLVLMSCLFQWRRQEGEADYILC